MLLAGQVGSRLAQNLLACLLLTAAAHKSTGPDMCWLILLSGGGESQSSSASSQGKLQICSPVTM